MEDQDFHVETQSEKQRTNRWLPEGRRVRGGRELGEGNEEVPTSSYGRAPGTITNLS